MQLHFDYTIDDYREANAVHLAATRRPVKMGPVGWILLGVAFVMVVVLVDLMRQLALSAPSLGGLVAVLGAVCLVGLLLAILSRVIGVMPKADSALFAPGTAYSGSPERPAKRPSSAGRGLLGWLLFIALTVMLYLLLQWNQTAPQQQPSVLPSDREPSPILVFIIALPWAIIVGFMVFCIFHNRRLITMMWEGQPALHQPHTADFSDQAVGVSNTLARHDHKWEAITHVRETPNLFLLYISNYGFHMIPKRALTGQAELDALREMLLAKVVERTPKGFEVVPPPLPAGCGTL